MQVFYNPTLSEAASEVSFNKEESRHIVKVLRMKEGDSFIITNGKGLFFEAEILSTTPKFCLAKILSEEKQSPMVYHLHMVVAPTKLNDRYEWFLEKATEIGVSEITPIICDRSERKTIKPERFEKIIQSAMKQSQKAYLPKLNKSISFRDFIHSNPVNEGINCIAHCEKTEKKSLRSVLIPKENTTILIGPEGDFSPQEIDLATEAGYIPVSLGKNRLRTETAAIVACHSLAFISEN